MLRPELFRCHIPCTQERASPFPRVAEWVVRAVEWVVALRVVRKRAAERVVHTRVVLVVALEAEAPRCFG